MFLLILIAIVLIGILSIVPHFKGLRDQWKTLENVPSLKMHPLLGHGYLFIGKRPPEILTTLFNAQKTLGRVVKYNVMDSVAVTVSDPKISEGLLSSQKLINKSNEYEYLKNWLGDGLLLSTGKKWFARRKAITPTFHFKILDQFVETFDRQSSILVKILAEKKPAEPVDIYPFITLAALDVICESAMGATINAQTNSDSEYVNAVKEIANIIHLRMFNIHIRNKFLFNLSSFAKRERAALKVLHKFTDSVIVARRNELLEKQKKGMDANEPNSEDVDIGAKKKMALLDVLLQTTIDGRPLSNGEIREETDTFMFEGHDTTTSGICFTLYNIAKHPEVQKKLIEEIHDVIGEDKTKPVSLQKLNDLNYLDLVIKESLRLFPPVPIIARTVSETTKIGDVTFPKNCSIMLAVHFMNRDPEFFPNPEEFRPERFAEERSKDTLNPYTYVPFSAGPRNCIGQKFAILEMKSMVSKVLRNFEISVDKDYKEPILIAELILRPENGLVLNFKSRN